MRALWALLIVLVMGGVLLTGGLLFSDESLEEEILDKLDDSPEPAYVHASMSSTADVELMTPVDEFWATEDGMFRQEFGEDSDRIIIDDGEHSWEYSPREEWVTQRDSGAFGNAIDNRYETTRTLFDELAVADIDTDDIDGTPVYHVEFEPPGELEQSLLDILRTPISPDADEGQRDIATGQYTDVDRVEIWLETEHLFPVKTVTEDEAGVYEIAYEDISFNPIPDEKFEFSPPDKETLEFREEHIYDSLSTARENASMPFFQPESVPSGFELTHVSETHSNESPNTSISMHYVNSAEHHLTFMQLNYNRFAPFDDVGEPVDIGNVTGYYSEEEGTEFRTMVWVCGDVEYFLIGHESIAVDELLAMAESIDCS